MTIDRRRHPRIAGGYAFAEQWSNAKAAFIGFLTGRGYSSTTIAEALGDGTSDSTIRAMQRNWELHGASGVGAKVAITVPMSVLQRANLCDRAAQHGLSVEEYSRRILVCASMPRDRYDEIVPEEQF